MWLVGDEQKAQRLSKQREDKSWKSQTATFGVIANKTGEKIPS